MRQTDEVIESRCRQTWYECAACGTVHTLCQPSHNGLYQRIGNGYRFSALIHDHR